MKIVLVGSPKGGVGKTAIAANLAHLLGLGPAVGAPSAGGLGPVAILCCDPQNAARFHFGVMSGAEDGWAVRLLASGDAAFAPIDTAFGVRLVPFGRVDGRQVADLDRILVARTDALDRLFASLAERGVCTLLCDLPPGPSAIHSVLAPRASMTLHVLLADPASAALLPDIEAGVYPGGGTMTALAGAPVRFVLNQVDWSFPLAERIARAMARRLGDRLLGAICRDLSVMDALAHGKPLYAHAPGSDAVRDLVALAESVARILTTASPGRTPGNHRDLPPLLQGLL